MELLTPVTNMLLVLVAYLWVRLHSSATHLQSLVCIYTVVLL